MQGSKGGKSRPDPGEGVGGGGGGGGGELPQWIPK